MRVFLAVLDLIFGISCVLINIHDIPEMETAELVFLVLVCMAFLGSGIALLL